MVLWCVFLTLASPPSSVHRLGLPLEFRLALFRLGLSAFQLSAYALSYILFLYAGSLTLAYDAASLTPGLLRLISPPPLPLPKPSTHRPFGLGLWLTPYSYILFLYARRTYLSAPLTVLRTIALTEISLIATRLLVLFILAGPTRTLYIL